MDRKLIVRLQKIRDQGCLIPRHQQAFRQLAEGIFGLREEHVPALNRHSRVARLLDAATGAPVPNVPALYDAVLLRATADEWVVTGFERIEQALQILDVAQTWVLTPMTLAVTPDWQPGGATPAQE